ncbi:MAG: hemerythrin family protein [Bacteroidales bacterium]|nr:hemerythrin family protein [Bacteroidales bacterium]
MNNVLVQWSDRFSVGSEEIDTQHKHLVDLLNQFFDSFIENQTEAKVEKILEELKTYALVHFKTEEDLFAKYAYPDTIEHTEEHQKFADKVVEFTQKFHNHKAAISQEILTFMSNWLVHHILISDKKYKAFFDLKGIDPNIK